MKLEKKQRFSIRKYAIGAASVLIGFAFGTHVVSADSVTPTPENPSKLLRDSHRMLRHRLKAGLKKGLKQKTRRRRMLQLHSLQQSKKLNPQ